MGLEQHRDRRLTDLGNEISDAVYKAIQSGVAPDFACSVIVGVAADYWRQAYTSSATALSAVIEARSRGVNVTVSGE